MDRTERFYKIEHFIRSRGHVSMKSLMEELGASRATLNRDLDYLRDRMDAPIVYDRFLNGYVFKADERDSRQKSHQLPGVWFNAKELHALLTMHQLISGLDDSGVLARHLQPMLDKVTAMLGTSEAEAKELMKRVKVISSARRPVPSKFFELIGDALLKRRRVHMKYLSRGRGEVTEREVSPQRLVHHRSTWYLDAWCHTRERLLRFALDAVERADSLDTKAKDVALKTVEAELDGGYGIFAGGDPQWATLVFSPNAAQWVSREEWHPAQKSAWLDDATYRLEVPFVNETELLMDVLRHGDQVSVVAPPSLVALIAQRLESASQHYKGRA